MAERGTAASVVTWSVPECPFAIECTARVLDDIRLAVTDAFFSLARGGVEIGGILMGRFEGRRVAVLDYAPLECEHAFGPSFTISLNDVARLRDLLAGAPERFPGLQAVGWYHSHTRSGIFLSDQDLEVYNEFFPEPWQIALVMKPHTFEPTRIGFFFRPAEGPIHASATYQELILEAPAMRPMPMSRPAPVPPPPATVPPRPTSAERDTPRRRLSQVEVEVTAEPVAEEPVIRQPLVREPVVREQPAPPVPVAAPPRSPVAATPAPVMSPVPQPPAPKVQEARPAPKVEAAPPKLEPVAQAAPEPAVSVEHPVPAFLTPQPPPRRLRQALVTILAAAVILGIIGAAVQTRELWMPKFVSAVRPAPLPPPLPPPSLGLHTVDHEGQLEIDWDRYSATVRGATSATLEIVDGGVAQSIPLDAAHLQTGTFTYGRQSAKVDVKLVVRRPGDPESHEATAFLGRLPDRKPPEDDQARKQRDELAAQAAKLKNDLNFQATRTKRLERDLQTVKEELRVQQKRRMANQAGEGK